MSLGLIASGCAAARAALSVLNTSNDQTWTLVSIDYWAFAEANTGIIAANLALGRMIYLFFNHRYGFTFGLGHILPYLRKLSLHSQIKQKDLPSGSTSRSNRYKAPEVADSSRDRSFRDSPYIPLNTINIKKTTEFLVTDKFGS